MTSVVLIIVLDLYFWSKNKAAKTGVALIEGREGWLFTL